MKNKASGQTGGTSHEANTKSNWHYCHNRANLSIIVGPQKYYMENGTARHSNTVYYRCITCKSADWQNYRVSDF